MKNDRRRPHTELHRNRLLRMGREVDVRQKMLLLWTRSDCPGFQEDSPQGSQHIPCGIPGHRTSDFQMLPAKAKAPHHNHKPVRVKISCLDSNELSQSEGQLLAGIPIIFCFAPVSQIDPWSWNPLILEQSIIDPFSNFRPRLLFQILRITSII